MVIALLCGCASGSAKTARSFGDWNEDLASLERGISTRRDVQRVLGAPDGSGRVLFPGEEIQFHVWYYGDLELKNLRQTPGGFRGDVRQQVLLVTFQEDVYDGFMWWSNAGAVK
jgi:hypothetical protein